MTRHALARAALGAACALLLAAPALAADAAKPSWFEPVRLGASAGAGQDGAIARLEARWDLRDDLWAAGSGAWRVRFGLEGSLGVWAPYGPGPGALGDVGFTPIFRLQGAGKAGLFLDLGVGMHLLTRTTISDSKRFSSAFQFGDRVAVGWRFGDRAQSELALRVQHYSNAGVREPNPGINYVMLQYSRALD